MPILRPHGHRPQHLTQLAHGIFLRLDQGPLPTDLKETFAASRQARESQVAAAADRCGPLLTRLELEQAVAELERMAYIEKISRPAGELFRLTAWGKLAAAAGASWRPPPCRGARDLGQSGRTYAIPTCENARLRGSSISSFARFKKIVTAHELGHSIGCLLPKKSTEGWGPNWLMREPDAEGTDLDEKEQARLRENAAKIP